MLLGTFSNIKDYIYNEGETNLNIIDSKQETEDIKDY